MSRTSYILWDDEDVHFVLDQHAKLDFYSASLLKQLSTGKNGALLRHIILIPLKQQSTGRHVALLRHIILIPSQSVFDLTP